MKLDSARRIVPDVFSESYFEARQKFCDATTNSVAYPCSTKGPSGEKLFTEVAYFGNPDAKRLLVLVSATHGAEGYCGSAAQLVFLQAKLHEALPPSTAVLMVHALNCYGFAWDRRVTAEGCDLNRNFIDFSKRLPANAGYEELHDYFVPADMTTETLRAADGQLDAFRSEHGMQKFRAARASGQYTRAGGMSYGGTAPTEARKTLERIVTDYGVEARRQVVIIDYHTGLGPYGYGELQCEQPSGIAGYERAAHIFGPSVTSADLGTSSSVVLNGTQDEFWQRTLGDRHAYVALEFGTYDVTRAWETLRSDLWLFSHHPEQVNSEMGRNIRNASKMYYYPQSADWKEMIVWRSHMVHRQAISALTSID